MADIQRYLSMVTSEHSDKPKFIALLTGMLEQPDGLQVCVNNTLDGMDLDAAAGIQLDIAGMLVGVSRLLPFVLTGGASSNLSDTDYRKVIKAKIAKNHWDGTIPGAYTLWNALFPSSQLVIHDDQDMTALVMVLGMASQLDQDLFSHGYLVPKPEGVKYDYSAPVGKVFAYGMSNDSFDGYGTGKWIKYS